MCTALAPVIGYDAAADIAKTAAATGRTIREVALEKTDLRDDQRPLLGQVPRGDLTSQAGVEPVVLDQAVEPVPPSDSCT